MKSCRLYSLLLIPWALVSAPTLHSAQPHAPSITPIEAIHVAELHTGAVADSVNMLIEDGEPVFRVDASRGGIRMRARVQAVHGRLLSLARAGKEGDWVTTYRWPGVRVVAHRGGALLGPPENTLPAIQRAIEVGADLIEIDIRQTKDGHLVLMHDTRVDRTTKGKGMVSELTLEQIRRLEIRSASAEVIRVPTLREALEAMRGQIDADLDFKEGDLKALAAVVRETQMVEASTFCSPHERCRELASIEPGIRLRPTADYPEQVPALIRDLRPALINLDWHAVTEEAVRSAHLGGCHAFVNCLETADTEFYARLAAEAGADYIQSDRPDRVVKLLKEMGLRKERPPLGDLLGTPLRASWLQYPLR